MATLMRHARNGNVLGKNSTECMVTESVDLTHASTHLLLFSSSYLNIFQVIANDVPHPLRFTPPWPLTAIDNRSSSCSFGFSYFLRYRRCWCCLARQLPHNSGPEFLPVILAVSYREGNRTGSRPNGHNKTGYPALYICKNRLLWQVRSKKQQRILPAT